MGCVFSGGTQGAFSGVEQQELLLKFADLRMSLHLSERDFVRMYRYFSEANLNDDGCIQLDEFLSFFHQDKSRFTVRVFDMFRDGNAEGITFKQWVFGLWNFCTTDSDALILFGFQLYDRGGKGMLDLEDVKHMLTELFGKDYETNPLARDLMKNLLETDYKGNPTTAGISATKFARVVARAKNLLYPAFKLQNAIQEVIFSVSYWMEKTEERQRLQSEGLLDIREVLDLVNAGRRRAHGHVARGGLIMPYSSARGSAETDAERAERERLSRLTEIVGDDEMATIMEARSRRGERGIRIDTGAGAAADGGAAAAPRADGGTPPDTRMTDSKAAKVSPLPISPIDGSTRVADGGSGSGDRGSSPGTGVSSTFPTASKKKGSKPAPAVAASSKSRGKRARRLTAATRKASGRS